MPWEDPAGTHTHYFFMFMSFPGVNINNFLLLTDCGCVDVPLRFQADCVGLFTCQVVLRSSCDTRVYVLEAVVTSQVLWCLQLQVLHVTNSSNTRVCVCV